MSEEQLRIGQVQEYWNVSDTRILKYTVEVYHKGLKEHKLISAPEEDMLENKVQLQIKKWVEKWENVEAKRRINADKEANIDDANTRSDEAKKSLEKIDNMLIHTLSVDDTVDWNKLKKKENFAEEIPIKPTQKSKKEYPPKPDKKSNKFNPSFTFFEKIFASKKNRKIKEYETKYNTEVTKWEKALKDTDLFNKTLDENYEKEINKWKLDVAEWDKRKETFLQNQSGYNNKIDILKESYLSQNESSIVEYCEMVLNNSEYPDTFPQNFELEYNSENKILIIEYELPSLECFPRVKDVKYIASKKELKETFIADAQLNKMFDDGIYKMTLRSIHEVFEADVAKAIEAISFNGWVKAINKATGAEENNCILSIQTTKNEFNTIDLAKVDPKLCFKKLKGVACSKLSSLTPVQPILQISRHDKRFVESYAVANQIDNTTNLAAMDWEDFEHLIRELFEKEFQGNGGEVKVTQASRDGGVDAIAFDPDPIRGGKIVIQAKRYTNTVGVSAVRDLYGTVVNEGATKGILVSTADYGPDAYEFSKGKPITLLNGSNLLHLLGKHGHHAKIDLKEAKKILAEKEK